MAVSYIPFLKLILGDEFDAEKNAEGIGRVAGILSMFEEAILRDLQQEAEKLTAGFGANKNKQLQ